MKMSGGYTVAGLFAGIGGIELGLHRSGHTTELLCEIEPAATAVLQARFPGIDIEPDVTAMRALPRVDVVAAGFPCQDLSQAGRTAGISGLRSGLIGKVFDLISSTSSWKPRWLLLENVPFMLQLDGGRAMKFVTDELSRLGYMWAYRVVDTRAFGIPQRRLRVILLASPSEDPRSVLFVDDKRESAPALPAGRACGFYSTEGTRGLGWAVDAVPTLKGGSSIGIASPPAIWMPDGRIVVPSISDAERLQGFRAGWTKVSGAKTKPIRTGVRWKLVGNAVSVPVSTWIGRRLREPGTPIDTVEKPLSELKAWPRAAWGRTGTTNAVEIGTWPARMRYHPLAGFLKRPLTPLSARAAEGFYNRALKSKLRFPPGFLDAVAAHLQSMGQRVEAA